MSAAFRSARYSISMMRAIRVREFGAVNQLVVESDVPIPSPGEQEVLIKVAAAGVNPVDTYIRSGNYAVLPTLPYTPGQDTAGTIEQVGDKVTEFKKGDRVLTVRTISGGYAEYATANTLHVSHLNSSLSFAQGAAIGVAYFTAYKALHLRAQAKPGESVLIHGASGAVGIASTQIAKALGMTVIGTAGSKKGLEVVKTNGADFVFNHSEEGYLQKIGNVTQGKGLNVILEMLANVNLQNDLNLVSLHGRIVVIGCRGPIEINPRLTMGKESSIMGVMLMGSTEDEWRLMRAALEAGQRLGWLNPLVSKTYPLEKAPKAHTDVMQNQGASGKLILNLENDGDCQDDQN